MAVDRDRLRDWHRMFGLILDDFFKGSPFSVEMELDTSKQQQFLDVAIIRRRDGPLTLRLPDGLEDLAVHNLITFKSHHEALTAFAMKELIHHDVAYRKLVSPSTTDLLPEEQFRLYAVSARFPQNLSRLVPWQQRQPGVYDCQWGTDVVRVIVVSELPQEPHNAPLHLFSASQELWRFGCDIYQQRLSTQTNTLLRELFSRFEEEGLIMSYSMAEFNRDYFEKRWAKLTAEELQERIRTLSPEKQQKVGQALPLEEQGKIAQALPLEEREKIVQTLPLEAREKIVQALPLEKRLAGLSAEQIREYLENLTAPPPTEPQKQ